MAFIPDEALYRKKQLKRSTWDVYEALCIWRNSKAGVVYLYHAPLSRFVEWTGLKEGTVRNAFTELKKKGWLTTDKYGNYILLMGSFLETSEVKSRVQKPVENSGVVSPVGEGFSPQGEQFSPVGEGFSPQGENRIYKDRVRGFDQRKPKKDQTHTPTKGADESPPVIAASPRVCVSQISVSKFSKQEIRRYAVANCDARGQPLGEGWIKIAWRTGDYDDAIEIFNANGGKVENSKPKSKWEQALERVQQRNNEAAPETANDGLAAGAG